MEKYLVDDILVNDIKDYKIMYEKLKLNENLVLLSKISIGIFGIATGGVSGAIVSAAGFLSVLWK
jgi:hypothetical protein